MTYLIKTFLTMQYYFRIFHNRKVMIDFGGEKIWITGGGDESKVRFHNFLGGIGTRTLSCGNLTFASPIWKPVWFSKERSAISHMIFKILRFFKSLARSIFLKWFLNSKTQNLSIYPFTRRHRLYQHQSEKIYCKIFRSFHTKYLDIFWMFEY